MNSLPSCLNGKIVIAKNERAQQPSVNQRKRSTKFDERLVGPNQEAVDRILCLRRDFAADRAAVISTGTSVTPSSAAKNIAKVFVKASGLNSRPSCAVSENTGMKLTVMTSSEKKSGRPTLFAASDDDSTRSTLFGSRPCSSAGNAPAPCARSRP